MAVTVMVVDDSALIRNQVKRALVGAGYDVAEVVDGLEAWERISLGERPAMIVCDVNMPRMNGIELLEQLFATGITRTVPVVMLTTEGQPDLVRKARGLGAKGWLVKPFKPELLVATVHKLTAVSAG